MDTLSSSVSTFRASALPLPASKHPPPHHQPQLRPSQPHPLSRRSSISNQNLPPPQTTLINIPSPSIPPKPKQKSPTHHAPATGYAAALLDISLCRNSAHLVFKDAAKIADVIRSDPVLTLIRNPFISAEEKSRVLVHAVDEHGKFEKHLTALVKMLILKNKFGIVRDVLDEFRRMYYELRFGSRASLAT